MVRCWPVIAIAVAMGCGRISFDRAAQLDASPRSDGTLSSSSGGDSGSGGGGSGCSAPPPFFYLVSPRGEGSDGQGVFPVTWCSPAR